MEGRPSLCEHPLPGGVGNRLHLDGHEARRHPAEESEVLGGLRQEAHYLEKERLEALGDHGEATEFGALPHNAVNTQGSRPFREDRGLGHCLERWQTLRTGRDSSITLTVDREIAHRGAFRRPVLVASTRVG